MAARAAFVADIATARAGRVRTLARHARRTWRSLTRRTCPSATTERRRATRSRRRWPPTSRPSCAARRRWSARIATMLRLTHRRPAARRVRLARAAAHAPYSRSRSPNTKRCAHEPAMLRCCCSTTCSPSSTPNERAGFWRRSAAFEQAFRHRRPKCRRAFAGAALVSHRRRNDQRVLTQTRLRRWAAGAPARGPPGDPLTTIRAAWADIVGDDVARARATGRAERERARRRHASGAWSHQLSFLEREIVRSVVALGVSTSSGCAFASARFARARGSGGRRLAAVRAGRAPRAGKPHTAAEARRALSRRGRTAPQRASRRRRCVLRESRRSRPALDEPAERGRRAGTGAAARVPTRRNATRANSASASCSKRRGSIAETVIDAVPGLGARGVRSHPPAAASRLG